MLNFHAIVNLSSNNFGVKEFFSISVISKICVKIIITKNNAADPKIRLLTKSISNPIGRVMTMLTA